MSEECMNMLYVELKDISNQIKELIVMINNINDKEKKTNEHTLL